MDVINSITTALLEYYPLTLTVLLECIGICQFGKPDWILETCETSIELPPANVNDINCLQFYS